MTPAAPSARSSFFWKLALAGVALIWGFSFVIMKGAVDALPSLYLLSVRFFLAAGVTFAVFRKHVRASFDRAHVLAGFGIGSLEWGAYALQTLGLAQTTAGKNAFLTGTYCVLVPFAAYLMYRQKLTRYNVGAAFLCLAGIGLVALDDFSIAPGDLLTLAGAVFFAVELNVVARAGKGLNIHAFTFWMFVAMGIFSTVASALFETRPTLSVWTPELAGWVLFLAAVCSCFNVMVQNVGLSHVPTDIGSLLLSLESPSGVLFSVLLAGEALSPRLLAGFTLIFLAIVLSETHFSFLRRRPAGHRS